MPLVKNPKDIKAKVTDGKGTHIHNGFGHICLSFCSPCTCPMPGVGPARMLVVLVGFGGLAGPGMEQLLEALPYMLGNVVLRHECGL